MNARVMSMLVGGVQQRHLRGVDNHVDAARLCKNFERFANLFLQRREEFLAATIVSSLRVFTLALNVLLQLFQLIDLRLQRSLIDRRSGGRVAQLIDLSLRAPALCVCIWVISSLSFWNSPFSLVSTLLNFAMPVF